MRGSRVTALLLAVGLAAGALSACSNSTDEGSPLGGGAKPDSPSDPADDAKPPVDEGLKPYIGDDFYAPPSPLPEGPHGTLIRYQPIDVPKVRGAQPYRILYLSQSVAGKAIAVSGTALVPKAAAPKGGRPLLTIAHGTTGIADECAPSKSPVRTELSLTTPMIRNGFLVAMSDYEGLGTPGRHPYLVGESEGRGVLDAITAAGALPNADPGKELAIAGYSQGGHGALWADQLAADWTPQYEVKGTFAGAPASEIDVTLNAAPNLPLAGFGYMLIAGIAAAYPKAKPADMLTPAGLKRLDEVDRGCVRAVLQGFAGTPASELIKPDGPQTEPWRTIAHDDNAGQTETGDPLLIIHSKADGTVPLVFSELLRNRKCDVGDVVERRIRDEGEDHTTAAIPAYQEAYDWLLARFGIGDVPVKNDCPTA